MTSQPKLFNLNPRPTRRQNNTTTPYRWVKKSTHWRWAKNAKCHHCGQAILQGFDNDWCAFNTHANPQPLTPQGELTALQSGIRTFTATRDANRIKLTRRERADQLRRQPPNTDATNRPWDVLAEHRCHQPPATPGETTVSKIAPPKRTRKTKNQPSPF